MTFVPRPLASGDTLNASRDQIRTNFTIAQDRFANDHVSFNDGDGLHKWCRFPEQAAADIPAAVANISTLYAKENTFSNLHLQSEGGQEYQLTSLSATTDTNIALFGTNTEYQAANATYVACRGGWTFLPGGLIMMYGRANAAAPYKIKFPFVFPSGAPYNIVVGTESTAIDSAQYAKAFNVTDTDFEVSVSSVPNINGIEWYAIGK